MTTFTSWETDASHSSLVGNFGYSNVLCHHGVKGQERGKRRYQYEDGSLTPLGRIHYGYGQVKERLAQRKEERKQRREERKASNIKNMSEADLRKAINRKKLELEYKELSKSKRFEKGLSLVDKLSSAYIENKKRKDEAIQKANEQKLEKQRLEAEQKRLEVEKTLEKQRLEVEQKRLEVEKTKADAAEQQAIAEKDKSKLDLEKLKTRAGRRMLAREAKTPLIKAKAELRRVKLDKRKSNLMSRVMDLISKNQDSTWKQIFNEQEHKLQGLKNIGEIARTEQSANQALKAEHETNAAKAELDKQLAYNEGKRLEYAENAAKRQYDREERQAKEKREKEKDKKDKK